MQSMLMQSDVFLNTCVYSTKRNQVKSEVILLYTLYNQEIVYSCLRKWYKMLTAAKLCTILKMFHTLLGTVIVNAIMERFC